MAISPFCVFLTCASASYAAARSAPRLARKYSTFLPLKLVPLRVEIPPMVEVLQWHKYHDQDPGYIWLRVALEDSAKKMLGSSPESSRKNASGR